MNNSKNIYLFSGNSNKPLARKVARLLDIKLGKSIIKKFSDGETYVQINEDVKNKKVYVMQSGSNPSNDNLMEMLIMVHALKAMEPKKIIAIIPFFPYRRMEKTVEAGESLTFELVADLLKEAGVDKAIVLDLHKHRSKRFFKFQRKELLAYPVIISRLLKKKLDNFVIVAPDKGSMPECKKYSAELGVPIVKAYKHRKVHDKVIIKKMVGEVKGKDVIIIDDEINTAGTLVGVVNELKKKKARNIYFACTHAVLSGPAIDRLKKAKLREVLVTDSIYLPPKKQLPKIKVISVAPLIAEAIRHDR
ncbi:ribose-phosphate pyrophosphokinase [Patescibacteria group bacterium]|nr:ribose-phosphate pyrophosphokinase [Patescibacteria group bacterium]MBU1673445.1 ribose-phosphate pyrophosphokinase [Patescibacteria group bacterium]MBU1963354.1 ribose-phosphate pyrophosphokinase [Patescibacteria group bacterium]